MLRFHVPIHRQSFARPIWHHSRRSSGHPLSRHHSLPARSFVTLRLTLSSSSSIHSISYHVPSLSSWHVLTHSCHITRRYFATPSESYQQQYEQWKQQRQQQQQEQQEQEPIPPFSPLLKLIAGINIAVYMAWQYYSADPAGTIWMYNNFTVSHYNFDHGRYWTLITSAFSQNTFFHLLFNLIAVTSLGRTVYALIGTLPFLGLYVGGGLLCSLTSLKFHTPIDAATAAYLFKHPPVWASPDRKVSDTPQLGSSGSAMSIVAVLAMCFPRERLLLVFIPMPVRWAFGLITAWDLYGVITQKRDGIGHAGHLGGTLFGLAFYAAFIRPRAPQLMQAFQAAQQQWPKPQMYTSSSASSSSSTPFSTRSVVDVPYNVKKPKSYRIRSHLSPRMNSSLRSYARRRSAGVVGPRTSNMSRSTAAARNPKSKPTHHHDRRQRGIARSRWKQI